MPSPQEKARYHPGTQRVKKTQPERRWRLWEWLRRMERNKDNEEGRESEDSEEGHSRGGIWMAPFGPFSGCAILIGAEIERLRMYMKPAAVGRELEAWSQPHPL